MNGKKPQRVQVRAREGFRPPDDTGTHNDFPLVPFHLVWFLIFVYGAYVVRHSGIAFTDTRFQLCLAGKVFEKKGAVGVCGRLFCDEEKNTPSAGNSSTPPPKT